MMIDMNERPVELLDGTANITAGGFNVAVSNDKIIIAKDGRQVKTVDLRLLQRQCEVQRMKERLDRQMGYSYTLDQEGLNFYDY